MDVCNPSLRRTTHTNHHNSSAQNSSSLVSVFRNNDTITIYLLAIETQSVCHRGYPSSNMLAAHGLYKYACYPFPFVIFTFPNS
jgi:hypothetical protein